MSWIQGDPGGSRSLLVPAAHQVILIQNNQYAIVGYWGLPAALYPNTADEAITQSQATLHAGNVQLVYASQQPGVVGALVVLAFQWFMNSPWSSAGKQQRRGSDSPWMGRS